MLDEVIHLLKISTTVSRQNNYDKLLAMFNDVMQGRVSHLGIVIGGTPQFLEDPRRGLYSDPAWQRRTAQSALVSQSGMVDTIAPVIRLEPLSHAEILQLLQRLAEMHQHHYDYTKPLSSQEMKEFLRVISDRVGADKLLTPGEIVRDFMSVLNILHQNPQLSLSQLLQRSDFQPSPVSKVPQAEPSGEFAEFTL